MHEVADVAAEARHLELVLEIRHGAQPAQDRAPSLVVHERHQQRREAGDRGVGQVGQHLARHLDPLVEREHRALGLGGRDADDDAVEQPGRAPHEILVAAGEGVERAGVDDGQHGASR